MERDWEASMSEDLSKKRERPGPSERSVQIQKRLDVLEERMKGFDEYHQLSEAEKEESRAFRRAAVESEYDEGLGSEWDDEDRREDEDHEHRLMSDYIKNWLWGHLYLFDETTTIRPMQFLHDPSPPEAMPCTTIQVFSAKILGLCGGLQFPLDVYGSIAARDSVDRRRNIIFSRDRDNCQTVTEQDPYLVLTGPSRAIVLLDPVIIEVMLKVKGAVECEDKILNFQASELIWSDTWVSRMMREPYTRKLSTLDLALGSIVSSVEATVFIRVTNVLLPAVFFVTARTSKSKPCEGCEIEDTDSEKILLLDSRHKSQPVAPDGQINLSRSVVSARVTGYLVICMEEPVEHSNEHKVFVEKHFPANKKALMRLPPIRYGSGAIELTVAWSLISRGH